MLVILSGSIEVFQPTISGELLVVVHTSGNFTGEISTIRGAGSVVGMRVRDGGEALEIGDSELRTLLRSDPELSEIIVRAYILRRAGLISTGSEQTVLIGTAHSADTLRVQQFLTRNTVPFAYLDADRDASVAALLDKLSIRLDELPVVLCRESITLRNPSNQALAAGLEMNSPIDDERVRDVIIVGAGPAGLAAAVYAASEGLDVLVLETGTPGGQAGSSSKIENYLGFPTGISGPELAERALVQAQKFGAEIRTAFSALQLDCERRPYTVEFAKGKAVKAHLIVIATGAEYRDLSVDNFGAYRGAGLYWAATSTEARRCVSKDVIVVGGGNSAGQAAMFLSGNCGHVHMLVRGRTLARSMSEYLVNRIKLAGNISVHYSTEIVALEGEQYLERVSWKCFATGAHESLPIEHVFLMTGAIPATRWLGRCVALDDKGFVMTGADILKSDKSAGDPSVGAAGAYETSVPGVFAIGDVRYASIKRVAAAVGEGAACIQMLHRALASAGARTDLTQVRNI